MRRALLVSCLLAAMTLPVYSHAGVQVTNTLETAWNADNKNGPTTDQPYDDNYGYAVNRLNIVGSSGDISTLIRIDAWRYLKRPTTKYKGKILPERLQIGYKMDDWKLTVGDFYKQLGRGLVLSFRKGDEVSADTAIRGAELIYSASGHKVTLFGGYRNQANFDPVTKLYYDEEDDTLAGFQYVYNGFDLANIGTHGLFYQPNVRTIESYTNTDGESAEYIPVKNFLTGGMYLDAPDLTDWFGLYIEANAQRRHESPGTPVSTFGEVSLAEQSNELGLSTFAGMNFFLGDFQITTELLHIDNFDQGERIAGTANRIQNGSLVNGDARPIGEKTLNMRPPTLVRQQDEITSVRDVTGGSAQLEYYIEDHELTLAVKGAYRLNGESRDIHELLAYGSVQWSGGGSRIKVESGFWNTVDTTKDEVIKDKLFLYVDWVQHVSGKWSIQTITDTEYRMTEDYIRGSTYLTLLKSGLGDITFEFGHDVDQSGQDASSTTGTKELQYFYAGQISAEVADGWKVTATGGSQRGGLKCIAGICRWFPPFAGGRIEVVSRF
jgi:hypothetical protein